MIRVVLADDSLLIRQGLVSLINTVPDVELVGECSDLPELLAMVDEKTPDVVITDIRMPPTHTDEGIQGAKQIRQRYPDTGVLVLSQFSEPEFVLMLFDDRSDGLGYLLKDRIGEVEHLRRAIHAVSSGGSSIDPEIIDVLVRGRSGKNGPLDRLTPREREVLGSIAEGLNNAAIAERLALSEKAVAKHINSIFSKLDLSAVEGKHKRVEAVLLWLAT